MGELSCKGCGKESTATYCPSCEEEVLKKTRAGLRNTGIALYERKSLMQAILIFALLTLMGLPLALLFLSSVLSFGDILGLVLFFAAVFAALFGEVKVRFLGYEEVYHPDGTTLRENWETVTLGRYLSLASLFLIFLVHWFLSGNPIIVPLIKVMSYLNKNNTLADLLLFLL